MQKLKVEDRYFPTNKHLIIQDNLFDLTVPKVMGILNATPDSFYSTSRINSENQLLKKVEIMVNEGVDIIDIGGVSSRPGADDVPTNSEIERILPAILSIKKEFPQLPISLDTYRGAVAKIGIENGVDIINDISAFEIDASLFKVITHYKIPYVLMHMKGTPATMQQNPNYAHTINEITNFLSKKIELLISNGVKDIIVDPGFGFGKTQADNFTILSKMSQFQILGKPILAGLSRKSMIYKTLDINPKDSLNGTTALNMVALQNGAKILRVHDVKAAKECIQLHSNLLNL